MWSRQTKSRGYEHSAIPAQVICIVGAHTDQKKLSHTHKLTTFPGGHTQAAAYLIGETAAEKIIMEYKYC